jgi:hypothetical protein
MKNVISPPRRMYPRRWVFFLVYINWRDIQEVIMMLNKKVNFGGPGVTDYLTLPEYRDYIDVYLKQAKEEIDNLKRQSRRMK